MKAGLSLLVLLAAAGAAPGQAARPSPAVDDENVSRAIQQAVGYLYAAATPEGIWDPLPPPDMTLRGGQYPAGQHFGGRTALVLYALATAGQQGDPRFRKALDWLMKQQLVGTYALSCRLQLIHQLRQPEEYRTVLLRDARLLERGARAARGGLMWDYVPPPGGDPKRLGDFSCVNYAVLGLWAASDERYEVRGPIWHGLERCYVLGQHRNGGWAYRLIDPANPTHAHQTVTGAMTAAGIASLYLIIDHSYARRGGLGGFRSTPAYKSIQRGLEWMAEGFSPATNPGRPNWFNTYYFYNCERVAAAAGLKYFGEHDWFREIAANLLRAQAANGAIPYRTEAQYGGAMVDTAFALLFLAKGSAPIIFNKLQHGGDWDNHLRELAALTGWLAKLSERPANWQVVDLAAPAEDLTDSRILYIAGTRPLEFTPAQRDKLERFVELGGLLLFHPDTAAGGFAGSAARLLAQMWPKLQLTSVDLTTHPIGSIYLPLKDARVRLQQLASPTRVFAFVVHGAPANAWERREYVSGREMFALGVNLHYFANDRAPLNEMPTKLTRFAEVFRGPAPAAGRSVTLARIKYGDNPHRWDPEPLAFERFARLLAAREGVGCQVKVVAPEQLPAAGAKLAHLTGVDAVEFTEAQWDAIDAWLKGGGTLIVDQAGGPGPKPGASPLAASAPTGPSATFDSAFRQLIEQRYGREALLLMPSAHPWLAGLDKVGYRNVMLQRRQSMRPKLEWMKLDDRPAIIYSPYDLTCGLLGCPNPLVSGAGEKGAYEIVSRLVLGAAALEGKGTR